MFLSNARANINQKSIGIILGVSSNLGCFLGVFNAYQVLIGYATKIVWFIIFVL
jgi:hypothetical protein